MKFIKRQKQQKRPASFSQILKLVITQIIEHCPWYFALYFVCDICHGLSYGLQTYLLQNFFDAVLSAAQEPSASAAAQSGAILHSFAALQNSAVALGAAISVLLLGTQILDGAGNFMYQTLIRRLTGTVNFLINDKSARLEALAFESPSALDAINKATEGAEKSVNLAFAFLSMIAFHSSYLTFMLLYLKNLKPTLAAAVLLLFAPMILVQLLKSGLFFRLEDTSAPLRRAAAMHEDHIAGKAFLRETRILGIYPFLYKKYIKTLQHLNEATWKTERRSLLLDLISCLATVFSYSLILLLLILSTIHGEITPGTFSAVFASIGLVFGIMEHIVQRNIGLLSRNLSYAKNLLDFLDLPEEKRMPMDLNGPGKITCSQVSFSYPNASYPAIKNLSLEIQPGETLAIVGENGSGKSTLANLLSGIYPPASGRLLIDNWDTKDYYPSTGITAVFQKFNRYKVTLKENITISDVNQTPDIDMTSDISKKTNVNMRSDTHKAPHISMTSGIRKVPDTDRIPDREEHICRLLADAGIPVTREQFPQGLDTILSTEFSGIDLSGGQWQKLAISRGLYRSHKMIILDEPTAAVDPLEETRIYREFAQAARGKTAILITHRIGSAKIADRIAVLARGSLAELGTHEQLMAQNGLYSQMYHAQADWYS